MRIAFLILLATLRVSAATCGSTWSNGYTYCRPITVDHTKVQNTTQTNYPMLFTDTLTYLKSTGNGGKVQNPSGLVDITFSSTTDGSSVLKFERVIWSATTGLVEFWIKIPSVSAAVDTTIYMFYGNASIVADPSDPTNTWDSHFKGVWHFGDGTTLTLTDSTANANNGTNHGATACAGQINGAACFVQASSQYIDVGNGASLEITGAITVEVWTKYTQTVPVPDPTYPTILSNRDTTRQNGYNVSIHPNDGGGFANNLFFSALATGTEKTITAGSAVVQNTIYSFATTYDGVNAVNMYINGGTRTSNFGASAIGSTTTAITFGRWQDAGLPASYWDGFIDEIRISDSERSGDWCGTTYNNTNSPSTFYIIGAESIKSIGGRTIIIN